MDIFFYTDAYISFSQIIHIARANLFSAFFCHFLQTILLFLVVLAFTYIIPRARENTLVDDDKLCNYRAICMYFMFFLLASGVVSFDSSLTQCSCSCVHFISSLWDHLRLTPPTV